MTQDEEYSTLRASYQNLEQIDNELTDFLGELDYSIEEAIESSESERLGDMAELRTDAMRQFDQAYKSFQEGLEEGNSDYLDESAEKFRKGADNYQSFLNTLTTEIYSLEDREQDVEELSRFWEFDERVKQTADKADKTLVLTQEILDDSETSSWRYSSKE